MAQDARVKAVQGSKPLARIGQLAIEDKARGASLGGVHGTAYGWLNAVTEYVDHEKRARSQDNRLVNAWFGDGAELKTKAYQMAVQMADGSTQYQDGAAVLDAVLSQTA
jgi:hypothetical protein